MKNIDENILKTPDDIYSSRKKLLYERLETIKITEKEITEMEKEHAIKTIRSKILGIFKLGDFINTILDWNEDVDDEIRQRKKEYLLSEYVMKCESLGLDVNALKDFITNPVGNTLFNKIIRILDDSPPDPELSNHLSNILVNMSNSEFQKLFEKEKFVLSQIELLTPQCLTILSDYQNWPHFIITSFSAQGTLLGKGWVDYFIEYYCSYKGINDGKAKDRILHSLKQLESDNYIEGHLVNYQHGKTRKSVV